MKDLSLMTEQTTPKTTLTITKSLTLQETLPAEREFETTSRGDVWTTFSASTEEEAAIKQAKAWCDLGHKPPFNIFVKEKGSQIAKLYLVKPIGWVAEKIDTWG